MPSTSNPPKLVHWSPRRGHLARDRPDLGKHTKIYEIASFQKVSRQKSTCFWWHTFAYYCIWSLIKPECTLWIRTRTLTCWNDLQISKSHAHSLQWHQSVGKCLRYDETLLGLQPQLLHQHLAMSTTKAAASWPKYLAHSSPPRSTHVVQSWNAKTTTSDDFVGVLHLQYIFIIGLLYFVILEYQWPLEMANLTWTWATKWQ